MEQASLPLTFYCRNARLCLKKASFCKKSRLVFDELSHLRKFESLVSSIIPSHPQFAESTSDKQIVELREYLPDCRKRIEDLELQMPIGDSQYDDHHSASHDHSHHHLHSSNSNMGNISSSNTGNISSSNNHDSTGNETLRSPRSPPSSCRSSQKNLYKSIKPRISNKSPLISPSATTPRSSPKSSSRSMKSSSRHIRSPKSSSKVSSSKQKKNINSNVSPNPRIPGSPLRRFTDTSPTKKQQGWGIWTANPQHDGSQAGRSGSPMAIMSPPRNGKKNSPLKGSSSSSSSRKPGDENSTCVPIVLPNSSPLKTSSSSGQSSHHKTSSDRGSSKSLKSPLEPASKERTPRSPGSTGKDRNQSEWLLPDSKLQESVDGLSHDTHDYEHRSPEKSRQRFRFASEFLQKKLEAKISEGQGQYPDTDEDVFGSSPEKRRMSSDRNNLHEDECSSLAESAAPGTSSCTPEMYLKHGHDHSNRRRLSNRLPHMDHEDNDTGRSQDTTPINDSWDKNYAATVEQKLHNESHSGSSSRKITPRSSRKKIHRKRDVLSAMDDVIRQAMDSDSAISNTISPRHRANLKNGTLSRSKKSSSESGDQVNYEELETKINSLQNLVGDLRGCLEGFTTRVEAEGEKWHREMRELEKDLTVWKDDRENELMGIKMSIKDEVHLLKDELRRGITKVEKLVEGSDCKQDQSANLESMKKQLDTIVANLKVDVVFELQEKLTCGMKKEMKAFEREVSKQFEGMKSNMDSVFTDRQQVEMFIDEKLEQKLSQQVVPAPDQTKDPMMKKVKGEINHLWNEVNVLTKVQEAIKETVEDITLAKVIQDPGLSKSDQGLLRKQLQQYKKETMQVRTETEDFKKEIEEEVDEMKVALEKVKEEGEAMKKMMDKMEDDRKKQVKSNNSNANVPEDLTEGLLIMEKVEGISQLYVGGLEDVRKDLLSFKLEIQDRFEEIEGQYADIRRIQQERITDGPSDIASKLPLRELVFDALESRFAHLESRFEQYAGIDEAKANAFASIEKDRKQTTAALNHAVAAAKKADVIVSEISLKIDSMMRQSQEVQKSFELERSASLSSSTELKRMSESVEKEMHDAMKLIAEAQEKIEKEISMFKESLAEEKEAASRAAEDATAAASKAEDLCMDISNTHKECEEWKRLILYEVDRARVSMEAIDEEKAKVLRISQGEVPIKADLVSQEDFNKYVSKTDAQLVDLEKLIRDVKDGMESHSARQHTESEHHSDKVKNDLQDMQNKLQEAFTRLEEASKNNDMGNLLGGNMTQLYEREQALRQDLKNLEVKICNATVEQADVTSKVTECWKKVRKLENMHVNMASSVEQVRTSTDSLQKSAAMWLQKLESMLQDLEKRITTLENKPKRDDKNLGKSDCPEWGDSVTAAQKERLVQLYNELSSFLQRVKSMEGSEDDTNGVADWVPTESRLESLETRVEKIESDTRLLDAKMMDFSVGVQTALEGASMAESKCSTLGGELVKLFRMIATTRKESPSKGMMMDTEEEQLHHHLQHHHHGRSMGINNKPCTYCKKSPQGKGDADGDTGLHIAIPGGFQSPAECSPFNSDNMDMHQQKSPTGADRKFKVCAVHGVKPPDNYPYGIQIRDVSPTQKFGRPIPPRHEIVDVQEITGKRSNSEARVYEGKLPITDGSKKLDPANLVSGRLESQLNSLKLNSGKVSATVSHRMPSSVVEPRSIRRAD